MTTKNSSSLILQKGKIPPSAIDLEETVLGALLIDSRAILEIEFLKAQMFYKENHQLIFEEILRIYTSSDMVDLLTIANGLRKSGNLENVGGDYYLVGLSQKVASSAHIEFHARIIQQKYIQRKLITISSEIIEDSYDEEADVLESLDNAYTKLNEVAESSLQQKEALFSEVISDVLKRGVQIFNKEILPGVETPIVKLTNATGGWRDDELIIMAARPGMGKTSFALKCGLDAAKSNIPTAFFSLEMSRQKLTSRILSMEYKIDNDKFNKDGLDPDSADRLSLGYDELSKIPFYIDDSSTLTIEQFKLKAKRLKAKNNIKLIIVDYLQLMTAGGGKGNREQEISKISRGLKAIAMELKIPVIALSQLSRAVETRGGSKRPLLSDLRESGAIEQDSDMVMFFYRPEYYGITEWEDDYDREPCKGEAEYIVAKNRNGGLIRNRMKFEGRFTLFSDIEDNFHHPDDFDASEFRQDIDDGDTPF